MKVLISDNISKEGVEILRKAGLDVEVKTGMSPDALRECINNYDGIVIRSATKVTADIIEAATRLKVIGRAGSGLDNVDKAAATRKGIVVMNTPGGNTITTAEHTMAMIFATARKIPQATASMKAGNWDKKSFMGVELYNKTLGIIGIGNIGKHVARIAQGIQMNVIGYDPFLQEEQATKIGIKKVSLNELFRESDFITIHTPLTDETRNLINKDTLADMKQGVRIINCARGGIINEHDLLQAIKSGKVAGAALDVFEKEPPPEGSPLVELSELVCTPHLGASTVEAQENVALAVAEQVADYLVSGTIRNAVNFPSIPADKVKTLAPYVQLAESMGNFLSQVVEGEIRAFNLEFRGEAESVSPEPVTMAALKGFLATILEGTVNYVNSPLIARERGIDVKVSRSTDAGDYHNMLTINVTANGKEFSIVGTLFSRKDPRIIKVNNYHIEIIPEGIMLFINNNDQPGVIGNIGTLLGEQGINIARMNFGRESRGGKAVSVVSVDGEISPETLVKIKNLPNILSVKRIIING